MFNYFWSIVEQLRDKSSNVNRRRCHCRCWKSTESSWRKLPHSCHSPRPSQKKLPKNKTISSISLSRKGNDKPDRSREHTQKESCTVNTCPNTSTDASQERSYSVGSFMLRGNENQNVQCLYHGPWQLFEWNKYHGWMLHTRQKLLKDTFFSSEIWRRSLRRGDIQDNFGLFRVLHSMQRQ